MSSIYTAIYNALCESNKSRKHLYAPKSGLHQHHIVPKHMGGADIESNYTYLNRKEHAFAHFLLWMIHGKHEDLWSLKIMRQPLSEELKQEINRSMGKKTSTWNKGKKVVHLPGSDSAIRIPSELFDEYLEQGYRPGFTPQSKKKYRGGKNIQGLVCVHKPGSPSFKRISPEELDSHLEQGYKRGSGQIYGIAAQKKRGPSPKRKAVTDGKKSYPSVHAAAKDYSTWPSTISYLCRSKNHPNWNYVDDT